jgi:hypothetical protein
MEGTVLCDHTINMSQSPDGSGENIHEGAPSENIVEAVDRSFDQEQIVFNFCYNLEQVVKVCLRSSFQYQRFLMLVPALQHF